MLFFFCEKHLEGELQEHQPSNRMLVANIPICLSAVFRVLPLNVSRGDSLTSDVKKIFV